MLRSTMSQGSSKIIMWLSNNKNLELGLEKVVPGACLRTSIEQFSYRHNFRGMSQADFWKNHPGHKPNMDDFSRNRFESPIRVPSTLSDEERPWTTCPARFPLTWPSRDKLGHKGPVEIEVPAMIDINTESIVMSINTKIMFNYNRTCTP